MRDFSKDIVGYMDSEAALFFFMFSRVEFALKRGGFLKGRIGGRAEPHWDCFARSLEECLFDKLAKAPEACIFFRSQPKRLVVKAVGEVEFEKPDDIKNLQMLFEAVRLVRNNLFHGEKPYIHDRDHDLIKASMFVLNLALNACHETKGCEEVPEAFKRVDVMGQL